MVYFFIYFFFCNVHVGEHILSIIIINRLFHFHTHTRTDKNELLAAKTYLEQAAANNLPEFLKALSDVLAHTGNSAVARTAAGLQLKNHLTSKDANLSEQYRNRWLQFPEDCRDYIKKNVSCIFVSI